MREPTKHAYGQRTLGTPVCRTHRATRNHTLGTHAWHRHRARGQGEGLGWGLRLRHYVRPGLIGQARRVAATVILASSAQVMPLRDQAVPPWLSCRSLASSPSPLPHCTHLPNFQWCGPPSGSATREHTPEYDSMADIGGCLCVDTSPSMRFETIGELSGSKHFGHSSLLYLRCGIWRVREGQFSKAARWRGEAARRFSKAARWRGEAARLRGCEAARLRRSYRATGMRTCRASGSRTSGSSYGRVPMRLTQESCSQWHLRGSLRIVTERGYETCRTASH